MRARARMNPLTDTAASWYNMAGGEYTATQWRKLRRPTGLPPVADTVGGSPTVFVGR